MTSPLMPYFRQMPLRFRLWLLHDAIFAITPLLMLITLSLRHYFDAFSPFFIFRYAISFSPMPPYFSPRYYYYFDYLLMLIMFSPYAFFFDADTPLFRHFIDAIDTPPLPLMFSLMLPC